MEKLYQIGYLDPSKMACSLPQRNNHKNSKKEESELDMLIIAYSEGLSPNFFKPDKLGYRNSREQMMCQRMVSLYKKIFPKYLKQLNSKKENVDPIKVETEFWDKPYNPKLNPI